MTNLEALDKGVFRIVSWNLHKGKSSAGRLTCPVDRDAALRGEQADLLLLQEVQHHFERGNMAHGFHPGHFPHVFYGANVFRRVGSHGNAIVSSHRIAPAATHRNLEISAHRFEGRGALVVDAEIGGRRGIIVNTHLALNRRGRMEQASALLEFLAQTPADWQIVAGDFNERGGCLDDMFSSAGFFGTPGNLARSFPAPLPLFRLDKIFVKNLSVVAGGIFNAPPWRARSDHLPIWADLRVEPA